MKYATINPCNNQLIKEFELDAFPDLGATQKGFNVWRKLSIAERVEHLKKVSVLLSERKVQYAELITLEMGKPIREAIYEIEKSITAFDYYAANAAQFLQPRKVATQASESYISFEPLGIIFSIMPWNFPFWQVFRFAVPTLIGGNATILKHAPNVPQCALAIQQLFADAGIPDGVFRNYFLSNDDAAKLIAHPLIAGISFTGSDTTGAYLAGLAGASIKKCVMELGGNDAFIVLEDADVDKAIAGAMKSRSINSGQSCNAAKRFIVHEKIADAFTQKLIEAVQKLTVGNPTHADTQIGPLARPDLADKVKRQIAESVSAGAVAVYGMEVPTAGNFVAPVVLKNVQENMTAFKEEIFGPVWSVVTVSSADEAIAAANNSVYGLGASVWTKNTKAIQHLIAELQTGNVFVNDIVKSDARMPFGGTKRSGFGRELSDFGLYEFQNIKTVYIS
jgi:succinate-semialdehyde dehydrogenase/glutarate-semialdehyde dehydrogenase